MIETSGLTRFFGARKAIEHVTFSVRRGETVALLGTNGSGKTTTMRVLCGYLPPTEGTAIVAGFDVISHSRDVRKAVGYLPEDVPLYNDLSIAESLRFFGQLRKMKGRNLERRIDEVIEQVALGAYRDVLILKLSKGYRQRAGLAIAILHEPEVLILDEPTVSIDPVQVAEIRGLIRSLGMQHTILLSTHQLSEAADLCDRAVILKDGGVVADGPLDGITAGDPDERSLTIEVEGQADVAERLLAAVDGVRTVDRTTSKTQASAAFAVTGAGARFLNGVVVAMVEAGVVVTSIVEVRPSLEAAFLELSREPRTTDVA
jgi:ABC-2 type transport system ATP-binding protein